MPRVTRKCAFGFKKMKRKQHWLATQEPFRGSGVPRIFQWAGFQ